MKERLYNQRQHPQALIAIETQNCIDYLIPIERRGPVQNLKNQT